MKEWIYGRNPVYETLRAQRRHFFECLVAKNAKISGHMADIVSMCQQKKIPIRRVDNQVLNSKAKEHQGVALQASAYPYVSIYDILERGTASPHPPLILILDTLQDPQNLGTLLRTADAVSVDGVLLPLRRTASVTPAVVNASSGACEHLFIAQMNLAQGIELLKENGFWVFGLEYSDQAKPLHTYDLTSPLAMVVGSEGSGMRRLIRQACDQLISLPMSGHVDSLNAAVAGSIALYYAYQQRLIKGKKTD